MTPMILGTFPAVARFVRRMDIDQSDRTATMNVCVPALREGKLGVDFKSVEHHDIKSYSSEQIPNRALAATRVAVKFTETYEETPTFDFAPYMDGQTYVSDTKQLRWTPAREDQLRTGHFTINAPATRGFCGFSDGVQSFDLGGVRILPANGFSAIYVTARRMEAERIEDESEVLIVAMGRGRNTGMKFNEEGNKVLEKGEGPILLEPISAAITVPGAVSVTLLDHDGRPTDKTLPVENGGFIIDGGRDKTPYYLLKRAKGNRE
jgi:hypothetical protein